MFPHWLAGCLIFLLLKNPLEITNPLLSWGLIAPQAYLVLGALVASTPDILSLNHFEYSKWSHKHRDNFSHSIFFPILAFLFWPFWGFNWSLILSIALLTHPLMDLYGLGWGVKLFYPFSNTTYKLCYGGKFLARFSLEKIDEEAEKYGLDNWIKEIYFSWPLHPYGVYEWSCLFIFLILLFLY